MSDTVSEIDLARAWEILEADPQAVLIDVRTAAEWQFVGTPRTPAGDPLLIEWNTWPDGARNPSFVDEVRERVQPEQTVLLLCRSGARSRAAAAALGESGFTGCHNVSAGFEGGMDDQGHRGGGWKDALPWGQT